MIFECEIITKVTVRIKADDEIQAQDYMDTHTKEEKRRKDREKRTLARRREYEARRLATKKYTE